MHVAKTVNYLGALLETGTQEGLTRHRRQAEEKMVPAVIYL